MVDLAGADAGAQDHWTMAHLSPRFGPRQVLRRLDDYSGRCAGRVHYYRETATGRWRTGNHSHGRRSGVYGVFVARPVERRYAFRECGAGRFVSRDARSVVDFAGSNLGRGAVVLG